MRHICSNEQFHRYAPLSVLFATTLRKSTAQSKVCMSTKPDPDQGSLLLKYNLLCYTLASRLFAQDQAC